MCLISRNIRYFTFVIRYQFTIFPYFLFLLYILDPRYKHLSFENESIKSLVINKITQFIECTEEQSENVFPPTSEETALNFLFFGTKTINKQLGMNYLEELQTYLQEAECSLYINPLNWWRDNANRYPNLSKLSKKYLNIPATSVPSERVFSTAGDIITAERSRLSSENASILIFLSENSSLY